VFFGRYFFLGGCYKGKLPHFVSRYNYGFLTYPFEEKKLAPIQLLLLKFLKVCVVQRSEKFRKTLELWLKNVGQSV
jgi:hypothetical protein